jgi:hypothetical protein
MEETHCARCGDVRTIGFCPGCGRYLCALCFGDYDEADPDPGRSALCVRCEREEHAQN